MKALEFLKELKESRDFDGNIEYKIDAAIKELEEIHKFFEEHTAYTDEKLAEYLNVDLSIAKQLLKEYADYVLGLKILKVVQTDGQCKFTAEL